MIITLPSLFSRQNRVKMILFVLPFLSIFIAPTYQQVNLYLEARILLQTCAHALIPSLRGAGKGVTSNCSATGSSDTDTGSMASNVNQRHRVNRPVLHRQPCWTLNVSASKVKLLNPGSYYAKVMQETFYELEERGFCNLRLTDFNQTLNETLYNWHLVGDVSYYNGFVVSIEKIQLTDVTGSASTDQAGVTTASFSTMVKMLDLRVGYDVDVKSEIEGFHRFTGIFTHSSVDIIFYLWKDMNTNEFTAAARIDSVAGGSGVRMVYMPESSISEVLSRKFQSSTFSNVDTWVREIIIPIILEKAAQMEFSKYCLNC